MSEAHASLTRSPRLLLAGAVVRIICRLDLREPRHAGGVDLGQPLLWLALGLDLAIPQGALTGDELPLPESLGEPRETPPGIHAMPSVRIS